MGSSYSVLPSKSVSSLTIYWYDAYADEFGSFKTVLGSSVNFNLYDVYACSPSAVDNYSIMPFICVATLSDSSLIFSDVTFICTSSVYSDWELSDNLEYYNDYFKELFMDYVEW